MTTMIGRVFLMDQSNKHTTEEETEISLRKEQKNTEKRDKSIP